MSAAPDPYPSEPEQNGSGGDLGALRAMPGSAAEWTIPYGEVGSEALRLAWWRERREREAQNSCNSFSSPRATAAQ
jgi:hypothetical protein